MARRLRRHRGPDGQPRHDEPDPEPRGAGPRRPVGEPRAPDRPCPRGRRGRPGGKPRPSGPSGLLPLRRKIMSELAGLRVAVLATDGVEESELTEPVKALREAGALVTVVSLRPGEIQAVRHDLDKTIK